jgi:thymidine kinase
MAKLSFKYGAMNSGKSDTLIKTAVNYTERGLSIITIKPSVDTKGDTYVFTGEQVAIDGQGEVSYDSLCGTCYIKEQAT